MEGNYNGDSGQAALNPNPKTPGFSGFSVWGSRSRNFGARVLVHSRAWG